MTPGTAKKPKGQDLFPDRKHFKNFFIKPVAENLYHDVRRLGIKIPVMGKNVKEFNNLSGSEKKLWYDYAEYIPKKLKSVNLFMRPFNGFCRTCIITDSDLAKLNEADLSFFLSHTGLKKSSKSFKLFCLQLNYLIPANVKKSGFEILRTEEEEEINMSLVKKLARSIHSRYLHEIKNQKTQSPVSNAHNPYTVDFDSLPEGIKLSNFDNAANIPAKLLAIGYKIRHVKKGFKPFALHLNEEEIETMSRIEHLRWSWEKRLNGWTFNETRDDLNKKHPGLIPYDDLSESEKEKDRQLVKLIPGFLQDIDYEAYPVSPNRIRRLSYALKPQSIIHKILEHTRQLNEQIKMMINLTPEAEEMMKIRNQTIEDAISEVEESYNYARHIQETFLPEDFTVREIVPDSFVLFKPKDIVSGDFYFVSKKDNLIIVAVADCTGHGIPGALLSTLGYSLLEQAVNELNITDPSIILQHLYNRIHRYLRSDSDTSGISDDMDIILCVLDTETNIVNYAGVKNPLYRVSKGELIEYRAQNYSGFDCEGECEFFSKEIELEYADILYLSSDGYPDQFGGSNHKKYSRIRMKKSLQNLQSCSMPEQGDRLYEEIENWREENNEDQTDDILVIGIKV